MVPILSCVGEQSFQLRPARHRAVVVHDFHDTPAGSTPRDGQVRRPPRARPARGPRPGPNEREDVTGRTRCAGGRWNRGARCRGPIVRDETPVVYRPSQPPPTRRTRYDGLAVGHDHLRQVEAHEALFLHGYTDDAAGIADHECDRLGCARSRRHDEVAFVLAILVVHDDDHAPRAQIGQDFLDGIQSGRGGHGLT